MNDYQDDFYGWTQMQAIMISDGRYHELDYENLVDEIKSLGMRVKDTLENHLETLLILLLKWQYIPNRQCYGWKISISEQRLRIVDILEENSGLHAQIVEILATAYAYAKLRAIRETGLPETSFPEVCPWDFEQLEDDGFLPDLS